MKWKIGSVRIDNQIVLAPMAGICDVAFRKIIKSMGCGLIETEMVSAKAIMYDNYKTKRLLNICDDERPVSQQLFGSDCESFRFASKYLEDNCKPDIIDINMGCPVPKVAHKSKAGSALLKHPKKVAEIVKAVVDTVSTPVTVKIRSGWDHDSVNAVEIAEIVESAGASAIAVHPRTKQDRYDIDADWSIIREVKDSVSIPVIGNGDIRSCFDAERMIKETNCDAVMIGRATFGNPWLIKECIDYLDNGIEPTKVTPRQKIEMFKHHTALLIETQPEKVAISKMRRHAAYYLKGLHGCVEVKPKIFKMNTKEELFELMDDYLYSLENY